MQKERDLQTYHTAFHGLYVTTNYYIFNGNVCTLSAAFFVYYQLVSKLDMSSQDFITSYVVLFVISATLGRSFRINSDSCSTSTETLPVSTTISISLSKPIIKLRLSHKFAIFKTLFHERRRGNVNFFL